MTEHQYRSHPAYANSDLTELLNLHTFKPLRKASPKIMQYGTTFHQLLLEPHRPVNWQLHTATEGKNLQALADSVRERTQDLLMDLTVEKPLFWECNLTGLPLKAKPDGVRPGLILDVKTTSSRSSEEFFYKFQFYGYDRQAAFYFLAEPTAEAFLFLGVQKSKPHNVYEIWFKKNDPFIETGTRKIERLLKLAHQESQREEGWRPSSWKRSPQ
jgi:hypothetical protein